MISEMAKFNPKYRRCSVFWTSCEGYYRWLKRIMSTFLGFALFLSVTIRAEEKTIIIDERPDWQKPVLENAIFDASVIGIEEILGEKSDSPKGYWNGFVLFSCEAKEKLGRRILWVDAKVKFSNGYTRKFKRVCFHISSKGVEYDLKKIPFETRTPVEIVEVRITSIAIK